MTRDQDDAEAQADEHEHDEHAREANLDGELHVEGECCHERSILGMTCRADGCGGRVHRQPIYGAIMEVCERCASDRPIWHTRGFFLTEAMVDDVGVEGSIVIGQRQKVVRDALARHGYTAKTTRAVCAKLGWRWTAQGAPPEWYEAWRGWIGPEVERDALRRAGDDPR